MWTIPRLLGGRRISMSGLAAVSALLGAPGAWSDPSGGVVVSGTAVISQSGSDTIIDQSSGSATIQWTDFSVASGETVSFNLPDSSSLVVNQVIGTGASQINGTITSNGQVWILNGNGVFIGSTGIVTTASGFLATTAQTFDLNANAFSGMALGTQVVNQGAIMVQQDGVVMLFAPVVSHSGTITTANGEVFLGSVSELQIVLDGPTLSTTELLPGENVQNGVTVTGEIRSLNGQDVELAGIAPGSTLDVQIVSTGGVVDAQELTFTGGEVVLIDGTVGGQVLTNSEAFEPITIIPETPQNPVPGTEFATETVPQGLPRTDAGFGSCSPPADVLNGNDDDDCLQLVWSRDPSLLSDLPFSNRGRDDEWR